MLRVISKIGREQKQQLKRNYYNRRQQIKKTQRLQWWLNCWRSLLLLALASGLGWVVIRPHSHWLIKDTTQIEIKGNQFISEPAIKELVTIAYPQSILRLPSPKLIQDLRSQPAIREISVTRQILPPTLTLKIKERLPVAIAFENKSVKKRISVGTEAIGFVDAEGVLLPKSFYTSVKSDFPLPSLRVIGLSQLNQSDWSKIYPLVSSSTVKISQIDGRNPRNLILTTELGKVFLGSYQEQLAEQFQVLSQMAELPSDINPSEIDYIDLTNPKSPAIHLLQVRQ